jgi:hypothetical protein
MSARWLAVLTTLAFLGLSGSAAAHPCQGSGDRHKHCLTEPPETGGSAQYTAVLSANAFEFAPITLDQLTANSRGTAVSGDFDIGMVQLAPVDLYLVDQEEPVESYIFNYHCPTLVDWEPAGFGVVAGNWSINYIEQKKGPGHVYIVMRNLEVDDPVSDEPVNADFDFDLHGDGMEGIPFLPEEGDPPSEFYLTQYKLWAGVGGRGGFVCNSDGRPGLDPGIKLTITRVSPPADDSRKHPK